MEATKTKTTTKTKARARPSTRRPRLAPRPRVTLHQWEPRHECPLPARYTAEGHLVTCRNPRCSTRCRSSWSSKQSKCDRAVIIAAEARGEWTGVGMVKLLDDTSDLDHHLCVVRFLANIAEAAKTDGIKVKVRLYPEIGVRNLRLHHHFLMRASKEVSQEWVRSCWAAACLDRPVVVSFSRLKAKTSRAAIDYSSKAEEPLPRGAPARAPYHSVPLLDHGNAVQASYSSRGWHGIGGQSFVWAKLTSEWFGTPEPAPPAGRKPGFSFTDVEAEETPELVTDRPVDDDQVPALIAASDQRAIDAQRAIAAWSAPREPKPIPAEVIRTSWHRIAPREPEPDIVTLVERNGRRSYEVT
jgi:hypothetical protein